LVVKGLNFNMYTQRYNKNDADASCSLIRIAFSRALEQQANRNTF